MQKRLLWPRTENTVVARTPIGRCVEVIDYQLWFIWTLRKYIFLQNEYRQIPRSLLCVLHFFFFFFELEKRKGMIGFPPGISEDVLSMQNSWMPLWEKGSEWWSPSGQRPRQSSRHPWAALLLTRWKATPCFWSFFPTCKLHTPSILVSPFPNVNHHADLLAQSVSWSWPGGENILGTICLAGNCSSFNHSYLVTVT